MQQQSLHLLSTPACIFTAQHSPLQSAGPAPTHQRKHRLRLAVHAHTSHTCVGRYKECTSLTGVLGTRHQAGKQSIMKSASRLRHAKQRHWPPRRVGFFVAQSTLWDLSSTRPFCPHKVAFLTPPRMQFLCVYAERRDGGKSNRPTAHGAAARHVCISCAAYACALHNTWACTHTPECVWHALDAC